MVLCKGVQLKLRCRPNISLQRDLSTILVAKGLTRRAYPPSAQSPRLIFASQIGGLGVVGSYVSDGFSVYGCKAGLPVRCVGRGGQDASTARQACPCGSRAGTRHLHRELGPCAAIGPLGDVGHVLLLGVCW